MDMDVHADPRLAVADRHHQIRRLPADARKRDQLFDGIRHGAAVLIDEPAADLVNGFGFGAVEADGIDGLFDALQRNLEQGLRRMGQRKQARTGFTCRLVFGPETEETGDQDPKGITGGLTGDDTDHRLLPLADFALDDPKGRVDLVLTHRARSLEVGAQRDGEGSSGVVALYSGFRFASHFCRRR
ncbi:hypothetical protein NITMOv2_4514 [Nitrospira moscoviensis]|uniref:Uncharacterized protein n=1 Tax=Nitrospira moscoviensis TaxID=42253 RepID=A0A0K2GIV5_NITMO|nr:hypothetical protein NITMOv2_4514 [Nitrospira moscoviensis]